MPDAMYADVARRTGAVPTPDPRRTHIVAEYFAAARVDLSATEVLAVARAWQPDLVVGEWCDFAGPLVARALDVPASRLQSTDGGRLMYSHFALLERQIARPTFRASGPLADELITPRQRALDRRHRRRTRPN